MTENEAVAMTLLASVTFLLGILLGIGLAMGAP